MDLSIIIINWNSKEYLQKCLTSLVSQTSGLEYEIIVIDAGSFDGCAQMLRDNFPAVRFLQSEANLGFARSNNAAFSYSKGECVLFLNPDTEIKGPALRIMYDALNRLPEAGSVGCRLLNADGTLQTSCIQAYPTILNQTFDADWLRALWPKSPLWGMSALFECSPDPKSIDAISGACVMLKRKVFEQVGLFSEDYFMYAEDSDLSYKVRRMGFKNYYLPDAVVVHFGGGSTQKAPAAFFIMMMRQANFRFLQKTRGEVYALGYRVGILFSALARLALLAAILPACRFRGCSAQWTGSFRKWLAILGWALNPGLLANAVIQEKLGIQTSSRVVEASVGASQAGGIQPRWPDSKDPAAACSSVP